MSYISTLKRKKVVMISDYVLPEDYPLESVEWEKEFLQNIKKDFEKQNYEFFFVEVKNLKELEIELEKFNKDEIVVFNWCEEVDYGVNTGDQVTQYLEKNGYIYTGADTKCLQINVNKEKTKKLLIENGVTTPQFFIIRKGQDYTIPTNLTYPVIIKSGEDHGSFELSADSVVENETQLREKVSKFFETQDRTILIEEFVVGDEYVVAILGNEADEILPIQKVIYDLKRKFDVYSFDAKWSRETDAYKQIYIELVVDMDTTIRAKIIEEVKLAYKTLGCLGYARMELRVKNKKVYVIDVNPNTELDGEFLDAAYEAGYTDGEVILKICEYAEEYWSNKLAK